jgi:hypothetical protein
MSSALLESRRSADPIIHAHKRYGHSHSMCTGGGHRFVTEWRSRGARRIVRLRSAGVILGGPSDYVRKGPSRDRHRRRRGCRAAIFRRSRGPHPATALWVDALRDTSGRGTLTVQDPARFPLGVHARHISVAVRGPGRRLPGHREGGKRARVPHPLPIQRVPHAVRLPDGLPRLSSPPRPDDGTSTVAKRSVTFGASRAPGPPTAVRLNSVVEGVHVVDRCLNAAGLRRPAVALLESRRRTPNHPRSQAITRNDTGNS